MNRSRVIILVLLFFGACTNDHFNEISSLCATTTISIAVVEVNASTCLASDGSLSISAKGGTKSYSFNLNGGTYQADSVFSNLKSGSYTIEVKDANGCIAKQIASINNSQSALQIVATTTANSGCPNPNGTITVTTIGGKNQIQYKLNSGAYQSSGTFANLAAGNYSITVIDSTGCPTSGTATIASNGPSFKTDISPIIISNCATSGCHNGNRSPNLSSYSEISSNGSSVVGAINNNMPPNGKLTSQQIATITCWVKDGALNN